MSTADFFYDFISQANNHSRVEDLQASLILLRSFHGNNIKAKLAMIVCAHWEQDTTHFLLVYSTYFFSKNLRITAEPCISLLFGRGRSTTGKGMMTTA